MVISRNIEKKILQRLADIYPMMLEDEGYYELLKDFDESELDGHLLYLWERGMINTEMNYDVFEKKWFINSSVTRINARGLDHLQEI